MGINEGDLVPFGAEPSPRFCRFCWLEEGRGVEFDAVSGERLESFTEGGTRGGFKDELPGVAAGGAFVEGGSGWRKGEFGILAEELENLVDFTKGSFFGFVCNREAGEVGIGREFAGATFIEEIFGESGEVGVHGSADDGVVGLVGLDDDFGTIEVTAADATDDLGEKFKSTFLGGEIGERETGVSLDDTDGGEVGKVKAASEGLGANEEVDFAGFDIIIELGETGFFVVVAVEARDGSFGEEARELGFEEFGAKTLMNDARVVAIRAAGGDFFFVAADVAGEEKTVSMEGHGEVTGGAESLPAAFFANCQG